jgi:hypothetical protein
MICASPQAIAGPQLRIAAKAPNSQRTGGYGEIPILTRSHVFTNLLTQALSFLHQIRARLRISQAGLIHRCFGSAQHKTRREQIPRSLFQRAFVSSIARATVLLLHDCRTQKIFGWRSPRNTGVTASTKLNDAFGCVEKLLSVNGHKPLDPLSPEDSFLGNAHVEFCPRSQIKILEIRGTIFWVVRHSENHVPRLLVRSSCCFHRGHDWQLSLPKITNRDS